MGKFYIHKDGFLEQTGCCPDGQEELQGEPGRLVGLGEPPPSMAVRPLPVSPELEDQVARYQRTQLLSASDWTQLPDVPLETKTAWAAYRQALRDVTAQPGFPLNVEWPIQPSPL